MRIRGAGQWGALIAAGCWSNVDISVIHDRRQNAAITQLEQVRLL